MDRCEFCKGEVERTSNAGVYFIRCKKCGLGIKNQSLVHAEYDFRALAIGHLVLLKQPLNLASLKDLNLALSDRFPLDAIEGLIGISEEITKEPTPEPKIKQQEFLGLIQQCPVCQDRNTEWKTVRGVAKASKRSYSAVYYHRKQGRFITDRYNNILWCNTCKTTPNPHFKVLASGLRTCERWSTHRAHDNYYWDKTYCPVCSARHTLTICSRNYAQRAIMLFELRHKNYIKSWTNGQFLFCSYCNKMLNINDVKNRKDLIYVRP